MSQDSPPRINAVAPTGLHTSDLLFVSGEARPSYLKEYITYHEMIHDQIFFRTPDAILHRLIVKNSHCVSSPEEKREIQQVEDFLWADMKLAHECAATYLAVNMLERSADRGALINGFDDEYSSYYYFFADAVKDASACRHVRCAAVWAITLWAFASERISSIPAGAAFDLSAYRAINGPSVRLEAWCHQLDASSKKKWVGEALTQVAQQFGGNPLEFDSDDFWSDIAESPMKSRADRVLITVLESSIAKLMALPVHLGPVQDTALFQALARGFNAVPLSVDSLSPGDALDAARPRSVEAIDVARGVTADRFRLFGNVPVSTWTSLNALERYITEVADHPLYISVAARTPDRIVLMASYLLNDGFVQVDGTPAHIGLDLLPPLFKLLEGALQVGRAIAPVTLCLEWSEEWEAAGISQDLVSSIAPGWGVVIRDGPGLEFVFDRKLVVPLVSGISAWTDLVSSEPGMLRVTKATYASGEHKDEFLFSIFTPQNDDLYPLFNISSEMAETFRLGLFERLVSSGSLKITDFPSECPVMVHASGTCWAAFAAFLETNSSRH